jgi:hypothetical protein
MRPSRWGAGCELSQVGVAVRLLLVEMGDGVGLGEDPEGRSRVVFQNADGRPPCFVVFADAVVCSSHVPVTESSTSSHYTAIRAVSPLASSPAPHP